MVSLEGFLIHSLEKLPFSSYWPALYHPSGLRLACYQ